MFFRMESRIDAPAEAVFAWHATPEALTTLIPPWEKVRVESSEGEPLAVGTTVVLRLPFGLRWTARHTGLVAGRMFRDEQIQGPFRRWIHTHRFEPAGPGCSRMIDEVEASLFGEWLVGRFVRRRIRRMFEYRHRVTRGVFAGRDDRQVGGPVQNGRGPIHAQTELAPPPRNSKLQLSTPHALPARSPGPRQAAGRFLGASAQRDQGGAAAQDQGRARRNAGPVRDRGAAGADRRCNPAE